MIGWVVVWACLPGLLLAQVRFSGLILDERTGEALPGATVYLPGLGIGAVSDSLGAFALKKLPASRQLLEISLPGYEKAFQNVELTAPVTTGKWSLRPAPIELDEVRIVGTQQYAPEESPYTVDFIGREDMEQRGSLHLSDAVARLPGVSQLSSGAGISKPVIRGLYGNRVQVNVMGLRFDNQQWQDEHGLGLSPLGIDRIEVIKGPASLQYGSDALGGVLNVIEEKPLPGDSTLQDVSLAIYQNTRGISGQYGIRKSRSNKWWRLRASVNSHADYSSSQDQRVLNSRFASYNLKASTGKIQGNWYRNQHVFLSFSQFGFVFDTLQRKTPDGRLSRSFDGPHHQVFFALVSSENTRYRGKSKLQLNGGWISNMRQEQEGGNRISLNMLLNTLSATALRTTEVGKQSEWSLGTSLLAQSNQNFGARIIVPDALTLETGLYSLFSHQLSHGRIQAGARYDFRYIRTFETGNLNAPEAEILPFQKGFHAVNGHAGLATQLVRGLQFRFNFSTGFRSGNLAELSSNGLHEGTLRWEVGNPDLKPEQSFCMETGLTWKLSRFLKLTGTVFLSRFSNYIYLAPDGTEYVGFQVYRFLQTDATLKGAEFGLNFHPAALKWLQFRADYSLIDAKKADGTPLPFIPANKIQTELTLSPESSGKFEQAFLTLGSTYVFPQDRPAEFETETEGYYLLRCALGTQIHPKNGHPVTLTLSATNLTDRRYQDHLSRYKYYGIYNMGRNISLSVRYQF